MTYEQTMRVQEHLIDEEIFPQHDTLYICFVIDFAARKVVDHCS